MRRFLIVTTCLMLVAGCGDDGSDSTENNQQSEPDPPAQRLSIELSGAVSVSVSGEHACSSTGFDEAWLQFFRTFEDAYGQVHIRIQDVKHGEVETGMTATVSYLSEDTDDQWTSEGCVVDLERNEEVPAEEGDINQSYLLVGSGQCSEPAEPSSDNQVTETIDVGDFEFACEAVWNTSDSVE